MKVVPDKKAVVVPLRSLVSAGLRRNSFERSAIVKSTAEVVLPFDVPTVEIMHKVGIDSPSPIRYYYPFKWSKDLAPFEHQVKTAEFITKLRRGFVCNDIGTGKTLSLLWAADYLMSLGLVNKVLIATTVSTIHLVWSDTLFTSFFNRKFQILTGTKQSRRKKLDKDADFYIINHDGLKVLCDWERIKQTDARVPVRSPLDDRPDIDMVIVDECAVFRNSRTDLCQALDKIAGMKTRRRLWMASGDPMPNKPTDMWAQANLVQPGLLGRSFVRFRQSTMTKVTQYKWVPKPGWERLVFESIAPYCIRFMRDDCVDLPERVVLPRTCEMGGEQKRAYQEMVSKCRVEMQGGAITAVNEGVKINKLLQISGGCVYGKNGEVHHFDVTEKVKLLLEALEHSHNKLIVFAPYVETVLMLERILKEKTDLGVGIVYGKISKPKRNEVFRDFKSGKLQILIAHPKTMAHGLDLTVAHTICWWSPVDDYEIFNQANGRITRPGQRSVQTIIELICSDIDKKIYKRLADKESMQGLLMELLTSKV